jgi:hypothetical protein
VLVVGAGRMGQRHLRGLAGIADELVVVDPREEARREAGAAESFAMLEEALGAARYDAAILAETAAGRLERLRAIVAAGVPSVLVEKPVEQSRDRVAAAVDAAGAADVRVNHFFRTLDLFAQLRARGGPFVLTVVGGAFGLACNGIHWIDLALYLSGDGGGRLLFGELDDSPISSGRGDQFGDYGGRALYGFADGSTMFLSSGSRSSAPMQATIVQPTAETVLFPHDAAAVAYRRELEALRPDDLWRSTARWGRAVAAGEPPSQPPLSTSHQAHELLFDLLELSGERDFPIT